MNIHEEQRALTDYISTCIGLFVLLFCHYDFIMPCQYDSASVWDWYFSRKH